MIKTKTRFKSIQLIEDDIRYGFNKIIAQNQNIYHLTISKTKIYSPETLRFILTNKLFNSIHKFYKNSFVKLDYLFVIEYPEKVSIGNYIPNNCEVHSHIVISTTLLPAQIEFYIQQSFRTPDIHFEKINSRNDKYNLVNYFLKQKKLFTDDNYNYKILT